LDLEFKDQIRVTICDSDGVIFDHSYTGIKDGVEHSHYIVIYSDGGIVGGIKSSNIETYADFIINNPK